MLMPIDGIGCGEETQGSRYWLRLVQDTRITPHTLMAASSGFFVDMTKCFSFRPSNELVMVLKDIAERTALRSGS